MKDQASNLLSARAFVRSAVIFLTAGVLLVLATTGPVMAKCNDEGNCKGGGKGDGDGNQVAPAEIGFDDFPGDRIRSDENPYTTEGGVLVAIGSKANTGNIFLRGEGNSITEPFPEDSRLLYLDLEDACALEPCTFPFDEGYSGLVRAGLRVDVNDILKDGVYALAVGGVTTAPMTLQFQEPGADVDYTDYWYLNFDPTVKNCEGATRVTVTRLGSDSWSVEGMVERDDVEYPALGCLVQGGHPQAESLGLFEMPFKFTVTLED